MSTAVANADIEALIARGEWWLRLFNALAGHGERRRDALMGSGGGVWRGISRAMDRAARGVRLALITVLNLEQILAALGTLRLRSAADIAALRARAEARRKTAEQQDDEDEDDFEDWDEDEDWDEWDAPDRETFDREPGGALAGALDRRLAAVDPILVDFEDLGLRETVERICADLGVTPDWDRWAAGDWSALEAPDPARHPAPAPRDRRPEVLPGYGARPEIKAAARRALAERHAERWRARLE